MAQWFITADGSRLLIPGGSPRPFLVSYLDGDTWGEPQFCYIDYKTGKTVGTVLNPPKIK